MLRSCEISSLASITLTLDFVVCACVQISVTAITRRWRRWHEALVALTSPAACQGVAQAACTVGVRRQRQRIARRRRTWSHRTSPRPVPTSPPRPQCSDRSGDRTAQSARHRTKISPSSTPRTTTTTTSATTVRHRLISPGRSLTVTFTFHTFTWLEIKSVFSFKHRSISLLSLIHIWRCRRRG